MKITGKIEAINEKSYVNKTTKVEAKFLEVHFAEDKPNEEFPESLLMTVFGDRVDNFLQYNKVGDAGELQFNMRVKPSKDGRLFNQITFFRLDKVAKQEPVATEDSLPF